MAKKFNGTNEEWDACVLRAAEKNRAWGFVLQSSTWAAVHAARKHKTVRIIDDAGNPSLWVLLKITHGVWAWVCSRGPMVLPASTQEWRALVAILQHEHHGTVLRIEPLTWNEAAAAHIPYVFKKRKSVSPTHTLITDIYEPFEKISKQFHEKTRYNIRVAEKHGVRVERARGEKLSAELHRILGLYASTGERHNIAALPAAELRALIAQCDVWVAWHEHTIIATSFHIGCGDTYTYLHGASLYEARAFMGPYALHAAAISFAHEQGFTKYDWWGVAPEGDASHPLAGVTRFKTGFGGQIFDAAGTYDIAIDRLRYALYTVGATIRRRVRS